MWTNIIGEGAIEGDAICYPMHHFEKKTSLSVFICKIIILSTIILLILLIKFKQELFLST